MNKRFWLFAAICLAIALHNIPEGISIAVPIYYSTGSKFKAIIYTLLSDEYLHAEATGHQAQASATACHNDRCIATTEPVEQKSYIDADGVRRCYYCDHML